MPTNIPTYSLTDDFSYQLGSTGVILNPDSIAQPFVDITNIEGLDSASFRTTERDHEGTDGGFIDAVYEKGRTITLEGMAYATGDNSESFLDTLKDNYAPSRTLVPFFFKKPGVGTRFLMVKPLGARYNVTTMRRTGCTEIQFMMFAEDPRIYTAIQRSGAVVQSPLVSVGRSYNRGYNYGYGATVTPYITNLINYGNRPTPVFFSINGPAENPSIINDTLGVSMDFTISVPSGSTLTVDTYYHTVRLDNANRRSSLTVPNWFNLAKGDNLIRFSSNVTGGSMSAQYYDAWR